MATIQRAVLASAILILLTALTCDHTADALTLHKLGMFRCSDGKYISLNKVCDMQNDCEKAEDENQNCYHDECPVWGLCDQLCTNSTGPYECRCHAGYESVNGTRCVAGNRTGPPPLVYFALERHVMAVDVRRQKQVAAVVQANASSACSGVDYHYARRRLFWTETGPGRILSVPLGQDATKDEPAVITVPGHWEPVAVAVDWVGDKLYVADRAGNKVDVLELNGRWHGIAIGSGLDRPVDVALDAARGYVFVADTEGLIRADMDGSNQRRVISLGVINLSGVTVDPLAKRIYWYDQRSGYIETSDYDGARRHNVFAVGGAELLSPVRLAVFEGNVYWTDYKRGGVFGVGKNDPNTMATVYNEKEINKPKAVKVYHQLVQEPVRSPCGKHNAGCMHMCIVTKGSHYSALTYRCACNIGFQLAPDQRTCVPANEFLLYVKQSHIKGKVLNSVSQVFNDAILPITAAKYADFSGLDFDAHENYIYYSDFVTNEIFRVRRNGTGTEIVLHNIRLLGASYGVEDLAVDWVAKNLYYVDARWGTLTVMSTRNVTNKKVLMADLNTPRSIVVHPNRGYVFYTEWDEVSKPVVSRVHTDGSNKIVLNMINWHRGLALDFANDRLYWCDSQMSRVQHSNLDGKDVKTIQLTDHKHPVAMVLNNEWMYIVDSHMMIVKLDKLTGVVSNVVVHENAPQIGQLKIYSVKEQRIEAQHPCSEQMDHGGCQKLCIAVPESSVIYGSTALRAQCHCPDGEKLDADGKSCVTIQNAVKPDFECPNPWQFTCYNMRCVAKIHVCDGTNNCLDNSDEEQNCTNLKPKVERNTAIKETTTTVTTTTRKYRATQSILAYDTWSG